MDGQRDLQGLGSQQGFLKEGSPRGKCPFSRLKREIRLLLAQELPGLGLRRAW